MVFFKRRTYQRTARRYRRSTRGRRIRRPGYRGRYRRRSFRRRGIPRAINNRGHIAKFISQDYDLVMFNNGGTNAYFRQCITFRPGGGETLSVLPQLSLSNLAASVASPLGTIPDGELGSWASLYSQTFLSKVIAKYTPAQTMGVSNQVSTSGETTFAASDAVMWTVPFYDNVDKFLSTSNTVVVDPDESGMSTVKVSPYARKHSIYRPWTRILRPSAFLFTNEYIGTGTLYHKRRSFMDFGGSSGSESSLDMNGLCIMMPALRRGGEANPSTTTPQFYPADGNIFVLGKLTFTYVQIFKTRQ